MATEIRLIAVGKQKSGPESELFERYNERLRPRITLCELPDGRGSAAEIKRREGEAILAALPPRAQAVVLDLGGRIETSEAFAARFSIWRDDPRPLCLIIGGAEGLDRAVIERADHSISLGKFTWPHMLVRVMLAEQIYRAQSILSGHPYHRAGRPE